MRRMTTSAPSETTTSLLSAASMRRLLRAAEVARRPLDEVIAQWVDYSLPVTGSQR